MVTFEHMLTATRANGCCRVLNNLVPEKTPVDREGFTMRRCKVCKSRHFNQVADPMDLKMTPSA